MKKIGLSILVGLSLNFSIFAGDGPKPSLGSIDKAVSLIAQGTETHGGGGLLCEDGMVTLYDLYEATLPGEFSEKGLHIVRSNDPVDVQRDRALRRLEEVFFLFDNVADVYYSIPRIKQEVPEGNSLFPPTDIKGELIKTGCELKGLASYNDAKNRLLVDTKLVNNDKMPKTDQAALWFHEAIYKILRSTENAQDSRVARRITGYIFSDTPTDKIPRLTTTNIKKDGEYSHRYIFDPSVSRKVRLVTTLLTENEDCKKLYPVAYYEDVQVLDGFGMSQQDIILNDDRETVLKLIVSNNTEKLGQCQLRFDLLDSSYVEVEKIIKTIMPEYEGTETPLYFNKKMN